MTKVKTITPHNFQIEKLFKEMDNVLESLKNESIRENSFLRTQAISRINQIQNEIHHLKIQQTILDFDGSPNKAA